MKGESNKVLQWVFSFIIGDNFFAFTNKTTFFELFNRDNICRKSVPCTVCGGERVDFLAIEK